MSIPWQQMSHESLEIGATPLVYHFLHRLQLTQLFQRHLPTLRGHPPKLSSAACLSVLVTNLLLAREPLYALEAWAARRVPEHLGLELDEVAAINDDRIGRALDHLRRADRASLLTALVVHTLREFNIGMEEFHQDTTTVTFSGQYSEQPPQDQASRPPHITFGYNKDHRPDLKQLVESITISADGAVPVHFKIYDGNTSDDQVHRETWLFLKRIVGNSDFLYVADSKLCTRENMYYIANQHGRFLTVMPRTRAENNWFLEHIQTHAVEWQEVHREPNPRRRDGPDVVYHGVESPQLSLEGFRIFWYRSSQKTAQDQQCRQQQIERAVARVEPSRSNGRPRSFRSEEEARAAGNRILTEEGAERWLCIDIDREVEMDYRQVGPGRPTPNTEYRRIENVRYRLRFRQNAEALIRQARCDGLFPLMTNDKELDLEAALSKYKYQPFVEKRHEQLKSVFDVMPIWLKSPGRIESLLWLYYVVQLVQALIEREVRRMMELNGVESLALYPERRLTTRPTTELVFNALEGHRRHRLLDEQGEELRRFHDALMPVAREVLDLLNVDTTAYGV